MPALWGESGHVQHWDSGAYNREIEKTTLALIPSSTARASVVSFWELLNRVSLDLRKYRWTVSKLNPFCFHRLGVRISVKVVSSELGIALFSYCMS